MDTACKQIRFDDASSGDLRCDCGKLLAKVLRSVLELKCSRCKRVVLVVDGRRYREVGAGRCTCPDDDGPSPIGPFNR